MTDSWAGSGGGSRRVPYACWCDGFARRDRRFAWLDGGCAGLVEFRTQRTNVLGGGVRPYSRPVSGFFCGVRRFRAVSRDHDAVLMMV